MFFLITIGIIAGFVSGLITGMVIYSRINRKMYGNVENTGLKLNSLIEPLKDSLKTYQDYIENIERERKSESGSLKENLDTLSKKITDLEHDTIKLSGALRNPSVRGKWGEITLRRTVEIAGMMPYCDFMEQVASEDGLNKPDMIIKLPNRRTIVVDSKVPLSGYFEHMNEHDDKSFLEKYISVFNEFFNGSMRLFNFKPVFSRSFLSISSAFLKATVLVLRRFLFSASIKSCIDIFKLFSTFPYIFLFIRE